ncbi:MAG TPA: hypothetical protein VKB86_22100 [Pyrinomonadaceae bacterium]|nr:hypothetical protein [Pyrinomonadaceae bacterium]
MKSTFLKAVKTIALSLVLTFGASGLVFANGGGNGAGKKPAAHANGGGNGAGGSKRKSRRHHRRHHRNH